MLCFSALPFSSPLTRVSGALFSYSNFFVLHFHLFLSYLLPIQLHFFSCKVKSESIICFHFFLVPFFCYFIIFYSIFSFFLFVSLNHSHQPLFFSYCYPIIQSSTEGFGSLPSVLTLLLCASKAVCACVCEILCTCVKQCVCIHVRVSSRG